MKKLAGAVCLLAACLCAPCPAKAQVITYTATLSGVTFADGSTLTGSFTLTPTDQSLAISNFNTSTPLTLSNNPHISGTASLSALDYGELRQVCGSSTGPYLLSLSFTNGSGASAALVIQASNTTYPLIAPGSYTILTPTAEAALTNASQDVCGSDYPNLYQSQIWQPANSALTAGTITFTGAPPKTLGNSDDRSGGCHCGDPIDQSTGNVFEQKTDYTTAGQNPLALTRYYNSMGLASNKFTYATTLGPNWRTNYDRWLNVSGSSAYAERPDGQVLNFTLSGSTWSSDTDVDYTLTNSGSTYTLTDHYDTVESYTVSSGKGTLNSITFRNGYVLTLSYSSGLLYEVTDSYSRILGPFTYTSSLLTNVETPDSSTGVTYGYTSGLLTTVQYPTTGGATTLTYVYGNSSFPDALTQITDQNSIQYANWVYDSVGRANESYLGLSSASPRVNDTSVNYSPSTGCASGAAGCVAVTNAFGSTNGVTDTYSYSYYQGILKLTQISRAVPSGTTGPTSPEAFTYDSNGYLATATDWNGNQTNYNNDSHGDPVTSGSTHAIVKASGTSVAENIDITYDTNWPRLPHCITTSGNTVAFLYSSTTAPANLQTRAETDTASGGTACSTSSGTYTRVWAYNTYTSTGQLEKLTDPLGNITQWSYSGGAVASITDAASHTTTINTTMSGGLPTKITDPNSTVTTLSYNIIDGGLPKLTQTVLDPTGSAFTTAWTYDNAGNLTKLTQPDSSYLKYTPDNAHRVTQITNANTECIVYSLDALGGVTEADTKSPASGNCDGSHGTLTRKQTATFDGLDRKLTDAAYSTSTSTPYGTTTYTYDAQGNLKTIQDPRGHTTTQYFDALNRLNQINDRRGNNAYITYDAHNRVLTVKDPNGNTTTYTRDGFGRATQIASPDSGTSSYKYDFDDNLTKKTDGAGIVTNRTFDALNRELTRQFPADTTQNVCKIYDQSGSVSSGSGCGTTIPAFTYGLGIGHLTAMVDNLGIAQYDYDERGNAYYQTCNYSGLVSAVTRYYDNADRISAIVYPSGWAAGWFRDSAGQVTEVGIEGPGASSVTPVFGNTSTTPITHLPFGPINGSAIPFGNGITRAYTYESYGYRPINITDTATSAVMNLSYSYDANDNIAYITDGVNTANTQGTSGSPITYDYNDEVTAVTSGSGGYGAFSYTYDANGNIASSTTNGTYGYTSGTNQLASLSSGSYTFGYAEGTGNAGANTTINVSGSLSLTLAYSQQQQVASITSASGPTTLGSYNYEGDWTRGLKSANIATGFMYGPSGELLEEGNTVGQTTDYVYLDPSSPSEALYPVALIENVTSMGTTTESTYYVHADRLGTPQYVTGPGTSKTVEWKAVYQPFGIPTITNTGGIMQNLGFPGMYFDSESGLYNNGARTYSPITGRYVQSDPFAILANGTTNTYAYANNNPFKFTDPSGLYRALLVTLPDGTQYIPLTKVKNDRQAQALGLPKDTCIAIPVPDEVDPQAQLEYWREEGQLSGLFPLYGPFPFFGNVYLNGYFGYYWSPETSPEHNYKTWDSVQYDAYGNFAYGATGEAAGFSLAYLQAAASLGKLQIPGTNHEININDINSGYVIAKLGGTLSTINWTPPIK